MNSEVNKILKDMMCNIPKPKFMQLQEIAIKNKIDHDEVEPMDEVDKIYDHVWDEMFSAATNGEFHCMVHFDSTYGRNIKEKLEYDLINYICCYSEEDTTSLLLEWTKPDFKLDDIVNGFVVETRNYKRFIVLDGTLLDARFCGHLKLKDVYNNNFEVSNNYMKNFESYGESINFKNMDIMKIFSSYLCLRTDDCDGSFLVWERR